MDWDKLPLSPDDFFGDVIDMTEISSEPFEAIILPLPDMVVYPQMVTPLYVGRAPSLQAVEIALREDLPLVAVAQIDSDLENYPTGSDLYDMGTEIAIARSIRLPDGSTSAIGQGVFRMRILEYVQEDPYLVAKVQIAQTLEEDNALTEALVRAILAMFEKVVQLNHTLPEEAYVYAMNVEQPGQLADVIAQIIDLEVDTRQDILETLDITERMQKISTHLAHELDVLELENQIQTSVQKEVDKSQREYFLREQMRAIQRELGEVDAFTGDVVKLRERINKLDLPDEVRRRAEGELDRLAMMPPMAPEVGIIRTYIDWLLNLPWNTSTKDNLDIDNAKAVLESQHYGLPKAKQRILEYIAVRKIAPTKYQSTILCFVGPPGTGKTSLGRSIAEALGRKFVRVSLGGIRDEAEIRGHRRTYIGALPGRIIQTMRKAGTMNPVFMLDEIDKIGDDYRGDPASALLEVLDPEQNHAFSDHYLEIPFDLSRVLFITTANVLYTIPEALEDRMEVIEFPGYTEREKIQIAKRFIVPRQIDLNGLQDAPPSLPDNVLHTLIRQYTYESGVRNLEREIAGLCRKAAIRIAQDKKPIKLFTEVALHKYIGPPVYLEDHLEKEDTVGVVMGLAWTRNGGDLLPVEVALLPGKGGMTLTGHVGDVMQESAQAAFTYMRSKAVANDIDPDIFDKVDVHIHFPEGGIPKDGPSGGVTIATALFSAFTLRPVRRDVAMTGEITLRGRMLAIGGLKEKLLAAHRAGVKTVILPAENENDLEEVPREIRRKLEIILANSMDDVLPHVLGEAIPSEEELDESEDDEAVSEENTEHTATEETGTPPEVDEGAEPESK